MAIQKINIGAAPNDKTGDQLREAFRKTNENFAGLDEGKVGKIAGKGLSTNDFTDPEKQKLAGLEGSHYRGLYASLADLLAAVSDPKPGDYADVDGGVGSKVMRHIWDESDFKWEPQQCESTQLTAAQVKALYESNADTNAFTDSEVQKLEGVTDGATKNSSDEYLLDRENHTGKQSLSTISDAGTSAAANTQTSHTDTTPGAVMTVGAFGIGGYLDMRNGTPLAASSPPSKFYGKGSIVGLVALGEIGLSDIPTAFGVITVNTHWTESATWGTQRKVEALGRTFVSYAMSVEDKWSPWLETAAKSVGGVADGAVIEYGENANGAYIKFAGGLLICMPVRNTALTKESFGAIFKSEGVLVNFPHEFSSKPSLMSYANEAHGWCISNDPSNYGVYLFGVSPLNNASVVVGCTAIGYWKTPS